MCYDKGVLGCLGVSYGVLGCLVVSWGFQPDPPCKPQFLLYKRGLKGSK